MRLLRVTLFAVVAVAVCSIAGFAAMFVLADSSMCANEAIIEVASPDAKHKAVVFQRDCGATTGFSTQVTVLPAGASLQNEPGNVFVADTNHGAAPSGRGGGPEVAVHWLTDAALHIAHHPSARVFKAERYIGDVQIDYGL